MKGNSCQVKKCVKQWGRFPREARAPGGEEGLRGRFPCKWKGGVSQGQT